MKLTEENIHYLEDMIADIRAKNFVFEGKAIGWQLAAKLECQLWRILQIQNRLNMRREGIDTRQLRPVKLVRNEKAY